MDSMLAQPSFATLMTSDLVMLLPKLVTALFIFAFGACVGSFLNVVAYRVPVGRSVVSPPSRCPVCGSRLSWHENLPIVGWLALRGRCRRCHTRISVQYPLIEVLLGVIFAGTYLLLFASEPGTVWREIGGAWWARLGFSGAWPAFAVLMTMVSGLVVATLIDARTFLIPGGITTTMTIVAFAGWTLQGLLGDPTRGLEVSLHPLPVVGWISIGSVIGALLGTAIANAGLASGRIPRSFADYDDYVTDDEPLAEYPHGRREMAKELFFVAPILIGAAVGGGVCAGLSPETPVPAALGLFGSAGLGWLVGGALVWAVRILGTLAFGREAMGMGDVHLLAAVGAALGWIDPIRVFFLAPFIALAWIAASRLAASFGGRSGRELPYGPHLAAATVVVVYGRPWVEELERLIMLPPG